MHLELALDPGDGSPPLDVVVQARTGTRLHAVHDQLTALLPSAATRSGPVTWSVGASALPGTAVLGVPPLVRAAVLKVAGAGAGTGAGTRTDGSGGVRRAPLEVCVAWGPAAGTTHPLPLGEHVVGRGAVAGVVLQDPEVSRAHAALEVSARGVRVRDLGSSNGTRLRDPRGGGDVGGGDVGEAWRELPPGTDLLVGASALRLRTGAEDAADPGAAVTATGDGHLHVSRSPRSPAVRPVLDLELPEEPRAPEPARVSVLAVVLPIGLSVVMAVVWSPMALLFGLAAPVITLGTAWGDRRAQRAQHARALEAHRLRCTRLRAAAAAGVVEDRAALSALGPDVGEVVTAATTLGRRLWERGRDDDQLVLRLGRGAVPSTVRLRDAGERSGASPHPGAVTTHQDAPVLLALPEVGVLGISGPTAARLGLVTSLLVQVAVLHSPRDVRVVVLHGSGAAPAGSWEWVGLLPHHAVGGAPGTGTGTPPPGAAGAAELLEEVRRREVAAERGAGTGHAGAPSDGAGEPVVVVVLDGAGHLRRVPGVAAVLERGPAVGVLAVCLEEEVGALPVECRAVAEVGGPHGGVVRLRSTAGAGGRGRGGWSEGPVDRALGGAFGSTGAPPTGGDVAADLVPVAVARTVARALAPLRDATPGHGGGVLPEHVALLDVLDVDATDPGAVAAAWSLRPRSTRVVLGRRSTGTWSVDLEGDGPHVLVAGTTGSGKSELLVALVTSLAVGNRPEELAVVLIDYKGGAAFADLAGLPHVVGLVTDLDAHLTQRALVSLQAEVRRRERVLRDAGCRDHAEHVRRRGAAGAGRHGAAGPVLPRLVVVVDEFRVLAEELPDFIGGLVRLAAVGRSLGVHLVLATQRPAGVVSADIRANTALRIALRVQDDGDSADVVDSRDAARIDARLPGRAVARSGSGPLVEVQAARVSGTRPARGPDDPTVRVRGTGPTGSGPAASRPDPAPQDLLPHRPDPPSDASAIVAALRRAAEGEPRPRSPWLPPLPEVVTLGTDAPSGRGTSADGGGGADDEVGSTGDGGGAAGGSRMPVLVLGVQDLPAQQCRAPLRWDVGAGPVLVVGAPRSGRTTAVRAVLAAATAHSPAALHAHVVATPSPVLAGMEDLPQVGAVIDPDDHERLLRLLHLLTAEVRRRQRTSAAGSVGAAELGPPTLLLVDGADRVLAAAGATLANPADDVGELLLELLVTGPAAGVVPLLTGDRSLLLGRCGALVRHRLLLALTDPADAVLAGVPVREVPASMPPGRVLVLGGATTSTGGGATGIGVDPGAHPAVVQAQIGVLGDPRATDQLRREVATLVAMSAERWSDVAARPPALPALPQRLTTAELRLAAAGAGPTPPRAGLPVGIGGDDLGVVALDVDAAPCWLVAGPAGSGRSTTLVALAEAAHERRRPVLVLAGVRSPLARWAAESVVPCAAAGDAGVVAAALAELVLGGPDASDEHEGAGPAPLVLVDDVERLIGTASEEVLAGHVEAATRQDTPALVLVAAGAPAELTGAYRGLVPLLRRARNGILLHPLGAGDGEVVGLHLPRSRPGPAGRATLVVDGRASSLQVALSTGPLLRLPLQSRRASLPGGARPVGPAVRWPLADPTGGTG